MKLSYEAVGRSISPTREYYKRRCGRYPSSFNKCDTADKAYKCLVEDSPRINPVYTQYFKDAFHGKVGA